MSKKGICIVADIFSQMQEARGKLFNLALKGLHVDKQDICLGQLLDKGKDAMKDRFCELTLEKGD